MPYINTTKKRGVDGIIGHFIFLTIFLFKGFSNLIKMLLLDLNNIAEEYQNNKGSNTIKQELSLENKEYLLSLLKGIDLINLLGKEELIEIILNNDIALKKLKENKRKSKLMKSSNEELKSLLKGVDKLYKLKKADLVDLVIRLNKDNKS